MARTTKPEKRKKTIPYNFGDKHKAYIRKSQDCMINVAEGAVRAGKTVDNVLAFCHELKTTKDKIHLASASTLGNAKIILGDCNGFGIEHFFRGLDEYCYGLEKAVCTENGAYRERGRGTSAGRYRGA